MSCASYGLTMPSTTRPGSRPSFTTRPDPFLLFPKTTRIPVGSSSTLKVKATIKYRFMNEEEVISMSFYELLCIPESVSLPEINHAYKQMALKYHPHVSPPGQVKEYTQRFIQVQEAYETLLDPMSRAVYDRDMAKGLQLAFSSRRRYNQYQYRQELGLQADDKTSL